MSDRAPYSRVYWSIFDDPKFVGIVDDDHHLACWLRLLINADMAHPSSAHVPMLARKSSVKALVECGLVDLASAGRYRIHGLEAERERRSEYGRPGGRASAERRTNVERTSNERATPSESVAATAKPSLDETRQAETPREDPASDYWSLTGRYPKDAALSWIDRLTETYGAEATTKALVSAYATDKSANTLLGRTEDALRAKARKLDLQERADEQARLKEKRAIPRVVEPWREEYRRRIEEQYPKDAA